MKLQPANSSVFLVVDAYENEQIFQSCPYRITGGYWVSAGNSVNVPNGTIESLIGNRLYYQSAPYEYFGK